MLLAKVFLAAAERREGHKQYGDGETRVESARHSRRHSTPATLASVEIYSN